MSNFLWYHGFQHIRPPYLSPTCRGYSNSHPSSWWCHPIISSSVVLFSSCPQSFPVPRSFPVSQPFALSGQSVGASASASVLPMNLLLFSCSFVSNSLRPHRMQHTRLPCPSLSPRACSNSWPSSHWCHPTISSSVIPFSSCLQSFPALGSFPMSQFFASGG